jgi:hypothetical protein
MTNVLPFPLDEKPAMSRAGWARPHAMPGFISRRITGAIIRFQPSLGTVAVALCAVSGAGLAILALLSARGLI